MADSEGTEDRDDDVPDTSKGQGDPLAEAGQGSRVPGRQDRQEPDRGVMPWQTWVRLVVEMFIPFVALTSQLIGLINGNGG